MPNDAPSAPNASGTPTETASATLTPQSGTVPLLVSYDLGASYDPDGSIVKYEIDCASGILSETTSPTGSCTFSEPGPHLIRLYAVDNSGLWDSVYLYAMALPAGSSPPADTTAPAVTSNTSYVGSSDLYRTCWTRPSARQWSGSTASTCLPSRSPLDGRSLFSCFPCNC